MRALLIALATLLLIPATAGAQISETLSIPTAGGDRLHVEIQRPATLEPVPIILTYSPYNVLGEGTLPNLANDGIGERYVPRGYARAVADVLGTRNSSGCWDYGGASETQSGVDLVEALAQAAVVERQGRDDRRLVRRDDREHGRERGRRRARRDRPGGRDQPLVRVRVQRRRALPRQLRSTRPTRASTRRWRSTSGSAARPRRRSRRSSSTRSPTGPIRATPPSTPRAATTRAPTTTTSGCSATTGATTTCRR